ncbi:hypothetical protein predicted by Glimmer/Critica [Sorangium cellulosum So ce56]|uniref:Secreted protein n=1 Tax=Sorangium cellulosum (strain So ce56) TaxID=448385 RepID=A9GE49_SORC5|nr:hypothetical protein [Sorangium cellulosum]CAN99442.1 hypothetical protein predicted by Glimmer/Critica [Sorangium cellulosum So ce56]
MNTRRFLLLILVISVWALAACNWTFGDCYPVEERTSGAGAGPGSEPRPIYTSAASGDFGADPQGGGEREIACNESDLEEEEEEERPSDSDSAEKPTASPTSPPDPCQQSGEPTMGCASIRFKPSDFKFVTTVADDGTDKGGGWQEAKSGLIIYLESSPVACSLRIGMPIRNSFWGFISADQAAMYSAEVTNVVAGEMERTGRFALPPGIFCSEFFTNVKKMFAEQYKDLGVVVNKS